MTDKQALRERYSPQPVPKCRICGAEMTVQRISGNHITYGCTGATYDDKGCHYAEGRSIADDHYGQSRVTVVDVSDPDVLALLDELEASKSKCRELSSKAMELVCEASLVYSKYNDTQMPDRDLVDMQTLQEMHDLCKGAAL